MMIHTVLLCLGLWTGASRANSAIASFRLNISDSDLLRLMTSEEPSDGSVESCPNDDDTFSFADPGWSDQMKNFGGGGKSSPVRQRYSQSDYLISSGESSKKILSFFFLFFFLFFNLCVIFRETIYAFGGASAEQQYTIRSSFRVGRFVLFISGLTRWKAISQRAKQFVNLWLRVLIL